MSPKTLEKIVNARQETIALLKTLEAVESAVANDKFPGGKAMFRDASEYAIRQHLDKIKADALSALTDTVGPHYDEFQA